MDQSLENKNLIRSILDLLKREKGIDFSGYRQASLEKRINDRFKDLGFGNYNDYLDYLNYDPFERDLLLDAITVNVSCFFRDPVVFDHMASEILPGLGLRGRDTGSENISIWSCGCATGEEPYSMAILLKDLPQRGLPPLTGSIFATDIDPEALRTAEHGCYPPERLKYVQLGHVERYFNFSGNMYCIKPEIRQMVSFSIHDILSSERRVPTDCIFRHFDIILCRNLLIYMSPETQISILKNFEKSLSIGGYLVLGEAESLHGLFQGKFEQVLGSCRIYRKLY